jgi:predicted CopG family antitoxin
MKDYLTIEKGISEIINKLNKLKKTAKEVCIKFAVTRKRGKITKNKNKNKNMFKIKNTMKNTINTMKNTNLNSSKGSQYNSYKSLKSASASNLNDSSVESPVENEPVSVENEPVSADNEVVSVEPTPTPVKI